MTCSSTSQQHAALKDCGAADHVRCTAAAAAELRLIAPPRCGHAVVSDSESDYEHQSCQPDIMGDSDIELDQQSDQMLSRPVVICVKHMG